MGPGLYRSPQLATTMAAKRFIVATDPMAPTEEAEFRTSLGASGFWHWLPNFWLVKSFDETLTAEDIRDRLAKAAPGARCFVTQVTPVAPWVGRVKPDAHGRSMDEWLRSDWEADD
jgi:hypothetical protein